MTDAANTPNTGMAQKQAGDKAMPIGRLSITEVDTALSNCEKTIKGNSDIVKAKLTANASIPSNVLRELSRANAQKARLTMRRITLLVESGDAAVMELLDKLMKMKVAKSASA
jgi:hypothetical protein